MKSKKWKRPKIKHNKLTKWHWKVSFPENLILEENVDIGAFTYIQARYGVILEKNVQIGGGCKIYSRNTINNVHGPVYIEENACIGANSVILPNVLIKKNQLIPAGSVVSVKNGVNVIKRVKE